MQHGCSKVGANMAKHRLTPVEIERVRVAALQWMSASELTAEDLARWAPRLRPDTVRKFLQGRRPSQRVAVELVVRFPLGLAYEPPSISASPETALAAAMTAVAAAGD